VYNKSIHNQRFLSTIRSVASVRKLNQLQSFTIVSKLGMDLIVVVRNVCGRMRNTT